MCGGSARLLDVRGLLSLRSLHHVETHLLTFFEGLEARHVDRGEMREQILAAVIRCDEAVAFRVVEPLHRPCCHRCSLFRSLIERPGHHPSHAWNSTTKPPRRRPGLALRKAFTLFRIDCKADGIGSTRHTERERANAEIVRIFGLDGA